MTFLKTHLARTMLTYLLYGPCVSSWCRCYRAARVWGLAMRSWRYETPKKMISEKKSKKKNLLPKRLDVSVPFSVGKSLL